VFEILLRPLWRCFRCNSIALGWVAGSRQAGCLPGCGAANILFAVGCDSRQRSRTFLWSRALLWA